MAVIQDLPPDLLKRIVELSVADWLLLEPDWSTMRIRLSDISGVSRSWRSAARELYFSLFSVMNSTINPDSFFRRLVDRMPSLDPAQREMRRLELLPCNRSSAELAMLQQHGGTMQQLKVFVKPFTFTSQHALLLQGLDRLELCAPVTADPTFAFSSEMVLTALSMRWNVDKVPDFLTPFSSVAPNLQHLELDGGAGYGDPDGYFSPDCDLPLQALGPRLRSLTIHYPHWPNGRGSSMSLSNLLYTCSSLAAFDVEHVNLSDLGDMLALLPATLTLLTTRLGYEFYTSGHRSDNERLVAEASARLTAIFGLPSLARLQRWRLTFPEDMKTEALVQRVEGVWRGDCHTGGIEPRGDEHYFTGLFASELSRIPLIPFTHRLSSR